MRKKKNASDTAETHDDGSYVVKKSKKSSILAFIFCLLIAFVIWAYAEATESSEDENAPMSDTSASAACICAVMGEI